MKHKIKIKAQQFAQSPTSKKMLTALKPKKSVWGLLGIIFFFIVPEIIAFIWGSDITVYAQNEMLATTSTVERQYYALLVMLFEEGISWINLGIGMALLIWFFF